MVPKKITEIEEKELVTFEPPEKLDGNNVIYYSHHARELKGTVVNKAKKFILLKCIQYDVEFKCFYCNPIKDYNKSRYKIWKEKGHKGFQCSCQACQGRMKKGEFNPEIEDTAVCSHVLAIYFWLKIRNWDKERVEEFLKNGD